MRPLTVVSAGFPTYGDYMGLAYARTLEAAGALPVQLPFVRDVEAVLDVADGVVLGFGSDDGVVEALELEGDAWVLGVQWELQEAWKGDAAMLRVFEEFVSATARPRAPRAAA